MSQEMSSEEFVTAARARLKNSEHDWENDPIDNPAVNRCLLECYEAGFSLSDAVRYTKYTEHVSPWITEEIACRRMRLIGLKYRSPKHYSLIVP